VKRPDFTRRAYPVLDVLEVHDGDTYRLLLDRGGEDAWFPWLRLKDFSCPELSEPGGAEARDAADLLLDAAVPTMWVVTYRAARPFTVRRFQSERSSLGRYLADVWLADDRRLGDELVARGLARPGARVG